jgi:hypothetical protein
MSNQKTMAKPAIAACRFQPPALNEGIVHRGANDRSELNRVARARSSKEKSHRHQPKRKVDPEKILSSFNVRTFRREPPGDPHLMLQFISQAVALDEPVCFVMYWGKGPRAVIAKPDVDCLDFLSSLTDRVREAYSPGATMKLIFTDTHAALNGHSTADIRSYCGEIDECARRRGFGTC